MWLIAPLNALNGKQIKILGAVLGTYPGAL